MKKFKTIGDLNAFFQGRKILVLPGHEWSGEETDFVEMCELDGSAADPKSKTGRDLRMKVRTKYGTDLLLSGSEFMTIERKIMQRPKSN